MKEIVGGLKRTAELAVVMVYMSVLVGVMIPSSMAATLVSTEVDGNHGVMFDMVGEVAAHICLRLVPPWHG